MIKLKHAFVSACKDKQALLEGVDTLKEFITKYQTIGE